MNSKLLLLSLALCPGAWGNSLAEGYTRHGNTVTISVGSPQPRGAQLVRLQVVNERIVRVEATAEAAFPAKQSLMVVPQRAKTRFSVSAQGHDIVVATSLLQTVVNGQTGHVAFYNADGKLLLSETESGGKTFEPFTVPEREVGVGTLTDGERHGWTWHMQFNSPTDEAFYGLGQHQAEELNMKGRNEELFQYNTKVSVPMVVSSRGYGLLWDTYSYCRWGNPEPYMQLGSLLRLYDRDMQPGALTGVYTDKDGRVVVRREDSIYFEHAVPQANALHHTDLGIDALPSGFHLDGAHVAYEGFVEAPHDGLYQFLLYYAGYVSVWMDGREVVAERWRTAWNPNSWKFELPLQAGRRVPIRIEWRPDGGVSYCGLRVAKPQTAEQRGRLSVWSEMSQYMDYYFIAGPSIDQVIAGYRTLTGKAPVYPKWVMGYWQSRERYKTQDELLATMAEFRRRQIPIDNIVQDWNYWQIDSWGNHTFEAARYPNPQAMLDSVHAMHGRFMISVWPKFYDTVDNYKELNDSGWMYQQAIADDIHDWLGYRGSFYDAYAAGARKVFWRQMDDCLYSKYGQAIDAWWMDASEPNVRDCTPMWYRKALCGPTALGPSTEYFNAYGIVNADAIYHGQRSVAPNKRVFLLTRSGFAGLQRYSTATWSGDIGTRWEDMRAQITAGLNYSVAGLPFWGMDMGGFSVEKRFVKAQQIFDKSGMESEDLKEWRELQARWNQFGCFTPIYRAHGQWPPREPWNIAPSNHQAYRSIVWYDRLRYRLMPYLYSMAGWVHFYDYTMMRPLVMDFATDSAALNVKDQWMFGPALMACPVTHYGARSRQVYLPRHSGWYNLYTGEHMAGGRTITASAPYERMPVFVPEGAIIPFGPSMQWSDEKPAELIHLYIYAGRDANFCLYEDEGTNYNYERGHYAMIDIAYDNTLRTVTIGKRRGSFNGMLRQRRFNIVLIEPGNARPLNLEQPQGKMISYDGRAITTQL